MNKEINEGLYCIKKPDVYCNLCGDCIQEIEILK
jgi:hypothetical protein